MSTNKIFIPALWLKDDIANSGVTMAQVSTAIANSTSGLLKVDGTRPMTGLLDINQNDLINVKTVLPPKSGDSIEVDGSFDLKNYDLDNVKNIRNVSSISAPSATALQMNSNVNMNNYNLQNLQGIAAISGNTLALRSDVTSYGNIDLRDNNEVINSKVPESDNGLARFKTVDNLYWSLANVYEKGSDRIYDSNQIVTASSFEPGWGVPSNAFDLSPTSQWIVSNQGKNQPGWIKIEYPDQYSIYKIKLYPRQGNSAAFQHVKRWTLEGSNDDVTYDYIHSKIENVSVTKETEFKVTRPYKYFKLNTEGSGQHGFSSIDLFPATVAMQTPRIVGNLANSNGEIPYVWKDSNNRLTMSSSENLKLNSSGELTSKLGHISLQDNLNMNLHLIEHVATPLRNHDAANRLYVDANFLTKTDFNVFQALPGLPVSSDLVMSFIPALNSCAIDASRNVLSITDPLSKIILSASSTTRAPKLEVSTDHLIYLNFNGDELIKEGVSVSDIGGTTGDATTFFFIGNTKSVKSQSQFNWMKGSFGNYSTGSRLGVHLPWSDSIVYVDHASSTGGRLAVSYNGATQNIVNKRVAWSYRRNGSVAELFLNGSRQITKTGLTAKFNKSDIGRFSIGNGNNSSNYATMDFYGLFFYNRALSDIEMEQMHLYLRKQFKI